MALYRTERRLNWSYALSIGHWYAPWSGTAADTGSDYFSRTLRWLRQQHPRAKISSHSHALPTSAEQWPQQRFGLPTAHSADGSGKSTNSERAIPFPPEGDTATTESVSIEPAHAGDLLIIEWPQVEGSPPAAQVQAKDETPADALPTSTASVPPPHLDNTKEAHLPPVWINGLERALRRHWQDNPEAEIIFVGGPNGLCTSSLALAAHYGICTLDPAPLLRPQSPDAQDHLKVLTHNSKDGTGLTAQGQEIWAGMCISLLRAQVRYGPTPEPVNLPDGLWCR